MRSATKRLTIVQGVPAMYARLLELCALDGCETPLASALRFAYAGGSPLDPTLKREVESLLGVPLHNGYGLTEAAPTVSQTRLDAPRADTSVGFPIPGVEVRVDAPDGQLFVRGPNVMQGYYRDPDGTAAVLDEDGWLDTGDLARQDPDGALFIHGRSKELIIRSGFKVYPLEVETVLNAHPAVTQSAVVGRVLPDGNEEVVAFVQPLAGSAPADGDALRLGRRPPGALQASGAHRADGQPAGRAPAARCSSTGSSSIETSAALGRP
jgi:long-chain acyl-CoA synthetase